MTILSVAIPTYNRINYLKNALSRMESFDELKNLKINYCISASACSDGTHEYLSKISNENNNIYINIKKSNRTRWNWIYLKKLIPQDTEWVWLFGDDDIIIHSEGWLPVYNLIKLAEKNNADIISIPQAKRIIKEDIHIDNLIGLSNRFGLHEILGWMTSVIVRRSVFIDFLNTMQKRYYNVYTDRGLLTTKVSPFFHALTLLNKYHNCTVVLALQNIVDEQVSIASKTAYTLNARNSEYLKNRLPFTFAEYKELICKLDETKNLSFYRYVNKTFIDLFINIIAENIIKKQKLKIIEVEFAELFFLYGRLHEKYQAVYKEKIDLLSDYINSKELMESKDKSELISVYNETKKDYLGNFIGEKFFKI